MCDVKKNNKGKYIICQHPMNLLIEYGDSNILEKQLPWGAKNIHDYVRRIHRNLDSLDIHPHLKINYEFSGVEMKNMVSKYPEIIRRMQKYLKNKRICFVNGTYSQPHLQVLGSESNLRQFLYGLKVFREIFGYKVSVYAQQESALHDQLPQILQSEKLKFAVVPPFYCTIQFIKGSQIPELVEAEGYLSFANHEEFTLWQGLDGTKIPLYLRAVGKLLSQREEEHKDLFHGIPGLFIRFPDMEEIDSKLVEEVSEGRDFALMDEALSEEMAKNTLNSTARLFTYWSYVEGMWAEALTRRNKEAEVNAIQAESLDAMASIIARRPLISYDEIWEKILMTQHHDIYWLETTVLKKKALKWLDKAILKSKEIINDSAKVICDRIDTVDIKGRPLVVFNTIPKNRRDVVLAKVSYRKGEAASVKVRGSKGDEIKSQIINAHLYADGTIKEAEILFVVDVPAFGYRTFGIEGYAGSIPKEEKVSGFVSFENEFYKTEVGEGITFRSLFHKSSKKELLRISEYYGNEFRAKNESDDWITTRENSTATTIVRGKVANILKSAGNMDGIEYVLNAFMYHSLPRIDLSATFGFDGNTIGVCWIDESKLNIYWPLSLARGNIKHDIPFGAIDGKENRPIFAINWLDISDDEKGLAYINRGTPKHWVRDGVIANVIAWGGAEFTNRLHPDFWLQAKAFDLNLYGTHTINYSVYLHKGDWREGQVVRIANECDEPLIPIWTNSHSGFLEKERKFFEIRNRNIVTTAIQKIRGEVSFRLYETEGEKTTLDIDALGKKNTLELNTLTGKIIKEINPFQIAQVRYKAPSKRILSRS